MADLAIVRPSRASVQARTRQPSDLWAWFSLPLLAFLILPLAALLLRGSSAPVWANLGNPLVHQAIRLSLTTTFITVGITLVAGTPLAYLLARREFRFKRALDTLLDLPIVMPPSVAGIALLVAFGRRGLLGGLLEAAGLQLAFTSAAVVLAQMFVAAPFYIRSATIGFADVDRELEQAAMIDGANRRQTFRYVTLPVSWAALLSGAVTTWARALGEFGATILFAGNLPGRTQTMPLAIYIGFQSDLDLALTLSIILIAFSFLTLIVVRMLLSRQQD